MIRYVLSALALKAFSMNGVTKRVYRSIGNVVGERLRMRGTYVDTYLERGDLFRSLSEKHDIAPKGGRFLEIGTGWLHWHSIYHRLFNDAEISMLDVWDCRQFEALKKVFSEVEAKLSPTLGSDVMARQLLKNIQESESFDDLYKRLNINYVVEPTGLLHNFPDNSFDCVFSFHVLEHVPSKNINQLTADISRVLKPGGISFHQIGVDDHLQHYDSGVSKKNYIKYSDRTWRWFFENELQYFNRLQTSEWLKAFGQRFTQLEAISEHCSIDDLKVNKRFSDFSNEELSTVTLTIVHRKDTDS